MSWICDSLAVDLGGSNSLAVHLAVLQMTGRFGRKSNDVRQFGCMQITADSLAIHQMMLDSLAMYQKQFGSIHQIAVDNWQHALNNW